MNSLTLTKPLISGQLDPCWSCNSKTKDCLKGCECAKCLKTEAYVLWKENDPDVYEYWLEKHGLIFHYLEEKLKKFDIHFEKYWQRQNNTFLELHTDPKDWYFVETKSKYGYFSDRVEVILDIPDDHFEIFPYDDKTHPIDLHCQLCGQKIKRKHYIRNNKKKIYLYIGGSCLQKFFRVEKLFKLIKKEARSEIRNDFKRIYDSLKKECWANPKFHNGLINPNTNKPAIYKEILMFWKRLKMIKDVNKLKTLKVMQLIKESEELGFTTKV